MANGNGYWLEMKVKIEDNPLLEIKREFDKDSKPGEDRICRVTPHIQPKLDDGMDLVSIVLKDKSDLPRVKQFIQTKYKPTTMQYIRGSESCLKNNEKVISNPLFNLIRKKSGEKNNEKVIFYSWVKSPSFNLIRECLLQGYELLHNPNTSERFLVYNGDREFLLGKVLRKAFEKSGAQIEDLEDKMDWIIRGSMISSYYPGLTLFQNYKYRTALESNFFKKYDKEKLSPLVEDIRMVTREEYDKEKLVTELEDIQKEVFDYLVSELSK